MLTTEKEAMIVAFRRHAPPLDDCLYALQPSIPHLTGQPCIVARSATTSAGYLHWRARLPRRSASRRIHRLLPHRHRRGAAWRRQAPPLSGDRRHIEVAAQLNAKADRPTAIASLEALIEAVPYDLHTILTDNGIQFTHLPKNRDGWTARYRGHRLDLICRDHGIEHRLAKPHPSWTNGQVEPMNRTIKEAPLERRH